VTLAEAVAAVPLPGWVANLLAALPLPPALQGAFQLPPAFEYGATLAWGLSGALVGARRGYDGAGLTALALVSATGGGLLRDGLFLQQGPPAVVRSPVYLGLVAAAALAVLVAVRRVQRLRRFDQVVGVVDAVGLGAYAVVGTQLAVAAGLTLLGAGLVGVVNAVGGGLLRDVLVRREPDLFRPGTLTGTAAALGVALYLGLTVGLGLAQALAGWTTVAAVLGTRLLSLRFGLTTRPAAGFGPPPPGDGA
jgi:uncharacterized membrane protein YeiH